MMGFQECRHGDSVEFTSDLLMLFSGSIGVLAGLALKAAIDLAVLRTRVDYIENCPGK